MAQRRERVFLLACRDSGDGCPAQVLAIPEGLSGHPAPSRTAGQGVAARVAPSIVSNSDAGSGFRDEHGIVAGTLGGGSGSRGWANDTDRMTFVEDVAPALLSTMHKGLGHNRDEQVVTGSVCAKWSHSGGPAGDECYNLVPQSLAVRGRDGSPQAELGTDGLANALLTPTGGRGGAGAGAIMEAAPRRLTPRECERLQGFPDDWTRYADDGKEIADGPRYRMLGNAVTVNVAAWIAGRIVQSEAMRRAA